MKLSKHFLLVPLCILLSISNPKCALAKQEVTMQENIPVATKWLLDAAGKSGRSAVTSVYMIVCPKKPSKGTGFHLKGGPIVTNEHVIRGCQANEIIATSPYGDTITFNKIITDSKRDLALLFPSKKLKGGLLLGSEKDPPVGAMVSTWGFPFGWSGPPPLLSVGYLSGYSAHEKDGGSKSIVKHLVVNGAFNPGNSGGPLFLQNDDKVIGVVVSKHAPITKFHLSAIKALAENKSGIVFTGTDEKGNKKQFVESQIVAEVLEFFRGLTQVMIGEAIHLSELRAFLKEQGVS